MYFIIWKYIVPDINKINFEFEYGSNGSWTKLFSKNKDYLGSDLIKSTQEDFEYLLIDKWTTEVVYKKFLVEHQSDYSDLSNLFKSLYDSETLIGYFESIDLNKN